MLKAPSKVLPSLPPPYETALAPTAHEGQTMIDARGLHGWLGITTRLHVWIARRIEEYGFTEGSDFRPILVKTGGRPKTEYLLTIGMAKELVMVKYPHIRNRAQELLTAPYRALIAFRLPI